MAGHWQSVREAADDLGVAPETLTRRLRSGRQDGVAASSSPVPPPPNLPYPRPQPVGSGQTPPPLPKPPLCSLPPGKPLPPPGLVTPPPVPEVPMRRATDAIAVSVAALAGGRSASYAPPRDRIDDAFMAAVEEELKEMRTSRGANNFTPAAVPASAGVKAPLAKVPPPVLEMADPLHAQVQDSKKQIRSMWVGIGILLLAVFAGVVWTTVRMDRAEQMISSLIQQLDSERTMSASYKQEIARLFSIVTDTRAEQAKRASNVSQLQADDAAKKKPDARLTSGK